MLLHPYSEFICYDDGCHLRKYATNSCRSNLTATTTLLSQLEIVIDKMHFAGHVDSWTVQEMRMTFSLILQISFIQLLICVSYKIQVL